MTALWVLYLLSYRRRVRPRTMAQHEDGSGHDVVDDGGHAWHCLNCLRTSEYAPPMTVTEWAWLALIVALAADLLVTGWKVGAWL